MRDLIARLGGMPLPKTGTTHYPAQLGIPEKGRAIGFRNERYETWFFSMAENRSNPADISWFQSHIGKILKHLFTGFIGIK